jgi:hypothetical protein
MDPNQSHSSAPPAADSKPSQSPITIPTSNANATIVTLPPSLVIRSSNTHRTVPLPSKVDSPARSALSSAGSSDHRDHKSTKDISKAEEVPEYVHHGIDPSAPIYEITHAIPDALILKCADCQRFARGTFHSHIFP